MCNLKLKQLIPLNFLIFVIIIAIWFASYPRWELPLLKLVIDPIDLLVDHVFTDGTAKDRFRLMGGLKVPRPDDPNFEYTTIQYKTTYGTVEELNMMVQVPKKKSEKPLDVWFEIHGGGFVMGDENFVVINTIYLPDSEKEKYVVFSPYYRLAPKYMFPTAPEDCYTALKWVKEHAKEYGGDPNRIIIGGTSAGGNLAAVTAMMARDDATFTPKPLVQILHIPHVDWYLQSESSAKFTHTPIWNTKLSLSARRLYIPDASQWSDVRASPLYAKTHKDLAPAFIIVDSWDPLHDDGIAYYEKLKADGVPVSIYSFEAYHGGDMIAFWFGGYKKEFEECGHNLKTFLGKYTKE